MKKFIIILVTLLLPFGGRLGGGLCSAQLLYEVYGNSAAAKSYILATNRYIDQTFIDSIPNCFACFEQCERVITEFALEDYEALATLRQAALLPDSIRLTDLFSSSDYDYIKEAFATLVELNLDELGRMKPSYLAALYRDELMRRWLFPDESRSMATFFQRSGLAAQEVAERRFSDSGLSAEGGLPVIGLDNASETMYIAFDREPLAWQCLELKKVIDYPEREVQQEKTIREMYRNGRLMDIAFQVEGPDNETSISYSDYRVFCQRNEQWAKRLTPYLKQGRTFVTLDAVYLGGDKGLLAQLKAQGFRIRPVNRRIKIK
ncbi:MAG: TraB/GumN family protein [Paludibacteraceae bacterium]|nr:TraB/GumN family protein [Paludibacteraceae bacterium]